MSHPTCTTPGFIGHLTYEQQYWPMAPLSELTIAILDSGNSHFVLDGHGNG
jgi:hypothetical protein